MFGCQLIWKWYLRFHTVWVSVSGSIDQKWMRFTMDAAWCSQPLKICAIRYLSCGLKLSFFFPLTYNLSVWKMEHKTQTVAKLQMLMVLGWELYEALNFWGTSIRGVCADRNLDERLQWVQPVDIVFKKKKKTLSGLRKVASVDNPFCWTVSHATFPFHKQKEKKTEGGFK